MDAPSILWQEVRRARQSESITSCETDVQQCGLASAHIITQKVGPQAHRVGLGNKNPFFMLPTHVVTATGPMAAMHPLRTQPKLRHVQKMKTHLSKRTQHSHSPHASGNRRNPAIVPVGIPQASCPAHGEVWWKGRHGRFLSFCRPSIRSQDSPSTLETLTLPSEPIL